MRRPQSGLGLTRRPLTLREDGDGLLGPAQLVQDGGEHQAGLAVAGRPPHHLPVGGHGLLQSAQLVVTLGHPQPDPRLTTRDKRYTEADVIVTLTQTTNIVDGLFVSLERVMLRQLIQTCQ